MQPSSWRQQSCIRVLKVQPGWEIILPVTWCLWLYGLFHSLACPKIKFKPSLLIQHLGVLARASGENTLKRRGSLPAPTRTGTNVGVSVDALTPAAHGPTMPGRTPQPAGDPQGAAPPSSPPPPPQDRDQLLGLITSSCPAYQERWDPAACWLTSTKHLSPP